MTQRTEGLVTYTEAVRTATVKRVGAPVAGITTARDAGITTYGVWSGDEDLSYWELRALRDAITVMLEEYGTPENATSNDSEGADSSLCENCGKEPSSAITADDVWLCKGCSASLDEEHRDRLVTRRAGERIIARLEKRSSLYYTGSNSQQRYEDAIAIVREECGVES